MSAPAQPDNFSRAEARLVADADFPTRWGHFRILGFEMGDESAVVLRYVGENPPLPSAAADAGPDASPESAPVPAAPLLRIHSQCLTGDVFGSLRCDCRQQLELALAAIVAAGAGLLIYEDKEGRGIGLMPKLQAYALQDQGLDTVEANRRLGFADDHRDYALPGAILRALGVPSVRLLSNNPQKIQALEQAGITVVERIPCEPGEISAHARRYLEVKRAKMGHLISR